MHATAAETNALTETPDDIQLPRLTRAQFWGIFAVSIVVFLFVEGPVWRHPWAIGELNQAILWSYVPIPLLVAGALATKRRLSLKAFFLDTLVLVLIKYSATFGLSLVLWSIQAPPPQVFQFHPQPVKPSTALAVASPSAIDPAKTGAVSGVVVDAGGTPVARALVFVSAGLEDFTFAPPGEPVVLSDGGDGYAPRLAAAMVGQRVEARSTDRHLHTLVGEVGRDALFNVPLLSAGVARPVEVAEPHGLVELRCAVHPHEPHAFLGVFAHPFSALTGADGRFSFRGVPEAKVHLSATRDGRQVVTGSELSVVGRGEAETTLRFDAL